jgi:serine/threonine-protein kinase
VHSGDDLAAILAGAPSGSTVTLMDDGPFDLRPATLDRAEVARLRPRDLTLTAAADARPVLRAARGVESDGGDTALLRFVGGRVTLEGLEFALDGPGREDDPAAVFAEDVDLTLRRCLFRRTGPAGPRATAAVRLRGSTKTGPEPGRPAPVRIVACHFDGGPSALLARGPAAIEVADTTFGPTAGPILSLDNASAAAIIPARLGLHHVSILAGEGPVLRLTKTAAAVRVDDSVIAPPRDGRATLVATDAPDRLDWLGQGNLYAGIGTYLQPTDDPAGRPSVRGFDDWRDDPSGPREIDSQARLGTVWADADPTRALARKDPTPAFRLAVTPRLASAPGTRRGPFGPILSPIEGLASLLSPERPGRSRAEGPTESPKPASASRPAPTPAEARPPLQPPPDEGEPKPGPMAIEPDPETKPAPMAIEPMPKTREDERPDEAPRPEAGVASTVSPTTAEPTSLKVAPDRPKVEPEPGVIRTEAQFLEALRTPAAKGAGGTLTLAADADLALKSCEIPGTGRWIIQAEAGPTRPRLRFRPDPKDAGGPTALYRLRSGALELRGLDVVLPEADAPTGGRWAVFSIGAGTDVSLSRCTVTVEGRNVRSAVVLVQAGDDRGEDGAAAPDPSAASVRATDCLLRAGGDLIDVAPGRRLDLELENTIVATGGSLVLGRGLSRGQPAGTLKLVLRRTLARNAGGLVRLESEPGEPELPVADVQARDTILATTADGAPLFVVDEQDPSDTPRDVIRWQGHGVAYHRIATYRRDQSAQPGSMPVRFNRPAWEVAVGTREVDPVHDDVLFLKDWDPSRPAWTFTPDDARLADDSPAASSGPDLKLIPTPPPAP